MSVKEIDAENLTPREINSFVKEAAGECEKLVIGSGTDQASYDHEHVLVSIIKNPSEIIDIKYYEKMFEKAGILKENVPVVFADKRKESSDVIKEHAKALFCPMFPVSKTDIRNFRFHKNFIDFSYNTRYYGYVGCRLMTCAAYQQENAALAVCALDVLSGKLPVSREIIEEGLQQARWEGRMEEILPDIILDGAHNIDGITAFLETVCSDGCRGRRLLLFSAVQEKQYREMTRLLIDSEMFDKIYLAML